MILPKEILKKYWGFNEFRPVQEDIINAVLNGNDALAILPTGGGKSLCYQVPAIAKEGICIVVSPLIALMKDQVMQLTQRNIKAVAIYSGMSYMEIDRILDNCVFGHYKLLYVSPERLTTEIMKVRAQKMNVNLIAVDEAHCISQWGYDFRPPYLQIADFRELFPDVPLLALTATATETVVADICSKLKFKSENIFKKSFLRKNLSYSVLFEEDKLSRVLKMLNKVQGSTLIYTKSRRSTREVSDYLRSNYISSDFYHAGLNYDERNSKQVAWMNNKIRVMVCTNAFGMGIDKPDVRLVIHFNVSNDLESYFQEAGRAGRDEKKSFAVLLYNNSDILDLNDRIKHAIPSVEKLKQTYQSLANYLKVAVGAGMGAAYDFDLKHFCNTFKLNPMETVEALKILQQENYILSTESVFIPGRIFVQVNKEVLYKFEVENKKFENIIRTLSRSYAGLFEEFVSINEFDIARNLKMSRQEVIDQLNDLQRFQLLRYEPKKDCPQIVFTQPRADAAYITFNLALLKQRRQSHTEKLTMIKRYVIEKTICRSQMLLSYFNEKDSVRCGICDVCLKRNKLDLSDLEYDEITAHLFKLLQANPLSVSEIVTKSGRFTEQKTLLAISWLLDNKLLVKNQSNQLTFQQ